MTKRILLDQLRPGMYVVGIDKSWWQTPFLTHKWTIQGPGDIRKLREAGIREVVIDLEQGCDVEEPASTPAPAPILVEALQPPTPGEQQGDTVAPRQGEVVPLTTAPPRTFRELTVAIPIAHATRNEALAVMAGIFEGVKIGKPIESPALKHAVGGLLDNVLHRSEATLILTQMQRFETTLLTHAIDVCVLALLLGLHQELPAAQLEALGVGAMLHDIGKTRLPRNLLRKTSNTNPQAQKLLREHPRLGLSVLANTKDLNQEVLRIVVEHHEYADGSGFPLGHTAEQLSPLSQIVGLVNFYDELVSGQDGCAAHQPTQALRRLYQLGKQGAFVSDLIMAFIRTLGVYPIGAAVALNTGECGIVTATNFIESQKPTVLVVTDKNGHVYAEPRLVNLAEHPGNDPVTSVTRPLETTAIPIRLADYFQARCST